MRSLVFQAVITFVGFCALVPTGWAATHYSVTDLGANAEASGINSNGQVVVNFFDAGTAYLWTPNTPNGKTGSTVPLNMVQAKAINNYGQIIGAETDFTPSEHAYLWTPDVPNGTTGARIDLAEVSGQPIAYAQRINAYGQVLGYRGPSTDDFQPFLWTPATPHGVTGTMTEPGGVDINASGQMVKYLTSDSNKAALWTPNTPNGAAGSEVDLGELGSATSIRVNGIAINDRGQVVGTDYLELSGAYGSPTDHGFLWTPDTDNGTTGSMIDLGDFPGGKGWINPYAINNQGVVAGVNGLFSESRAFVWTPTDGMLNLNTLLDDSGALFTIMYAFGINDAGQIVGEAHYASDSQGIDRAVLLTPVPEPGAIGVLFLAYGTALCFHRRSNMSA